jgi:hypothetical protein
MGNFTIPTHDTAFEIICSKQNITKPWAHWRGLCWLCTFKYWLFQWFCMPVRYMKNVLVTHLKWNWIWNVNYVSVFVVVLNGLIVYESVTDLDVLQVFVIMVMTIIIVVIIIMCVFFFPWRELRTVQTSIVRIWILNAVGLLLLFCAAFRFFCHELVIFVCCWFWLLRIRIGHIDCKHVGPVQYFWLILLKDTVRMLQGM